MNHTSKMMEEDNGADSHVNYNSLAKELQVGRIE